MSKALFRLCKYLYVLHNKLVSYFFKSYIKCELKHFGANSWISEPLKIQHPENISIGKSVGIGQKAWLAAVPLTNAFSCELIINDGTRIGDFSHIYATNHITIGKNVLIANFVYISDNLHTFENIETPIIYQPIKQLKPVVIGEGCWIGEHVSVIGASVGKHSVIGANAVVTKDIPNYCVAVGAPAHIIKRYNFDTQKWEKTDKQGNFI